MMMILIMMIMMIMTKDYDDVLACSPLNNGIGYSPLNEENAN
jgi:hypothetical protein